jgi:hypothetical protein
MANECCRSVPLQIQSRNECRRLGFSCNHNHCSKYSMEANHCNSITSDGSCNAIWHQKGHPWMVRRQSRKSVPTVLRLMPFISTKGFRHPLAQGLFPPPTTTHADTHTNEPLHSHCNPSTGPTFSSRKCAIGPVYWWSRTYFFAA